MCPHRIRWTRTIRFLIRCNSVMPLPCGKVPTKNHPSKHVPAQAFAPSRKVIGFISCRISGRSSEPIIGGPETRELLRNTIRAVLAGTTAPWPATNPESHHGEPRGPGGRPRNAAVPAAHALRGLACEPLGLGPPPARNEPGLQKPRHFGANRVQAPPRQEQTAHAARG